MRQCLLKEAYIAYICTATSLGTSHPLVVSIGATIHESSLCGIAGLVYGVWTVNYAMSKATELYSAQLQRPCLGRILATLSSAK